MFFSRVIFLVFRRSLGYEDLSGIGDNVSVCVELVFVSFIRVFFIEKEFEL